MISDESRAAIESIAEALHGGSLRDFANERKRLVTELRQAGNRAAAAAVAKLPRPTLSAWLVNRLWREARPEFDALFDTAARIRRGELGAVPEQRAALARLRGLAAQVLRADGHAAAESTLQRTSSTLQALAAAGSFDPDPPGRLLADRDPPGFESMVAMLDHAPREAPETHELDLPRKADVERPTASAVAERVAAKRAAAEREAARRAAAERAAAKRAAEERAHALKRATAELANLERLAEQAREDERAQAKTVEDLRAALQRAEAALVDARSRAEASVGCVSEARARLDALTRDPKPST